MPYMCRLLPPFFVALAVPLSIAQAQEPKVGPPWKKEAVLQRALARAVKPTLKTVLPERVHCPELLDFERLPLTPTGHLKDDDINFSEMGLVFQYYQVSGWLKGYLFASNKIDLTISSRKLEKRGEDVMLAVFYLCRMNPTSNLLLIAEALARGSR